MDHHQRSNTTPALIIAIAILLAGLDIARAIKIDHECGQPAPVANDRRIGE